MIRSLPSPQLATNASEFQEALPKNCRRCGTELGARAEFCHICGQWVFGSSFARMLRIVKAVFKQGTANIPLFSCLAAAVVCVACALLVGVGSPPKTAVEWQAIQFWRIEWLLAAIVALLFGQLLKKS